MKKSAIFFAIAILAAGCIQRNKPAKQAPEPAERIICLSSSHVAFLDELGAADRIVAVSGAGFISDSLVKARWKAGSVAEIGWDGNFDLEKIAAAKPDLVLASRPEETTRLVEMGLRCEVIGDWLETTPLARASWIVRIAGFCGLDSLGIARFAEITRNYNELAGQVAKKQTGIETKRPVVMFNAPYRDIWYAPGDDNYMVRLIEDAGGEYVFKGVHKSTESRPVDMEEAYLAMLRADVWLNTNHYTTLTALLADCPRFGDTPPVRNGMVFNNNARTTEAGGSDFWESGVVRPDLILRDLIAILHGREAGAETNTDADVDGAGHPDEKNTGIGPESPPAPLYYYRRLL